MANRMLPLFSPQSTTEGEKHNRAFSRRCFPHAIRNARRWGRSLTSSRNENGKSTAHSFTPPPGKKAGAGERVPLPFRDQTVDRSKTGSVQHRHSWKCSRDGRPSGLKGPTLGGHAQVRCPVSVGRCLGGAPTPLAGPQHSAAGTSSQGPNVMWCLALRKGQVSSPWGGGRWSSATCRSLPEGKTPCGHPGRLLGLGAMGQCLFSFAICSPL